MQQLTNEDIFLFKAIAGRDDDIEDMNMLVQAGLDYDVVRAELETQIERLGDDQFATFANEALVELEERYGVTTPIETRVQELTNRYYRGSKSSRHPTSRWSSTNWPQNWNWIPTRFTTGLRISQRSTGSVERTGQSGR